MINLRYRTLLEAGEVPLGELSLQRLAGGPRWRATKGVDGYDNGSGSHCGVLSEWARAIVAGVSLREGEGEKYKGRFAFDNPLAGGAVLELSGALSPASVTPMRLIGIPGRIGTVSSSEHPLMGHISDPTALPDLPAGSIDLLVCDATWLSRISPTWLSDQSQALREGKGYIVRVPARTETREAHPCTPALCSNCDLQRGYLRWLLGHCRRIVKSTGVCVLAYQHILPSAWETLSEALIGSGWSCSDAVPFPASIPPMRRDIYLYPRRLAWDALLVCRPRAQVGSSGIQSSLIADGPASPLATSRCETGAAARSQQLTIAPVQMVVDRAWLEQATTRVRDLCPATEKRRLRMEDPDRLNLWRALVVAQALRASKVGPADPIQAQRSTASLESTRLGRRHSHTGSVQRSGIAPLEQITLADALRWEPDWKAL